MKKILLIVLVLLFQYSFSKPLTETQKLAATCKVWGFLKYYHPNVADGSKNWDEQLFQILPKVEEAKSTEEFSSVIENWITSLGEVKAYKAAKPATKIEYFDKNFNLSWFSKNELFSKSLSKKLKFIEENRIRTTQFYVKFSSDEKGVSEEFSNEIKYPDFKWTENNLRLLALFRYWNYVEYFFPYKYQMNQDWDLVLDEMLPKFIAVASELDFHLLMRELSVKLDDTHASIGTGKMFERFGDKFIPADVKIIDNKAVIIKLKNDSLAKISDLRIGDVITKVEGKTIAEILAENRKYIEGSNDVTVLRNAYWTIFNGNSDDFEIEFERQGTVSNKRIKRYMYQDLKIQFPNEDKWKILEGNIGYVNFNALDAEDVPSLIEQLKNTKAIIFDNRAHPHSIMYPIADWLNPGPKDFAKFIYPDISYPGRFFWQKDFKCGKENKDYYKGKTIVLVNEETQSHGEFTTMCLQAAPNATVIGGQTAGADGNIVKFQIIKGFGTSFTGLGVFYPNKKETQRIGIVPDIEVKPTILGIQQGKDEVLDRAILFAKNAK